MAEKSAFFNSVNGDRIYKAEDFAEYFSSFISNGIFPNPSTGLQIISNNDMTVILKPGKAWINGYFYVNTDDLVLSIDVADGVLNRIDRVVLRLDYLNRNIRAVVKKGQFASEPVAPELQRDADVYELGLADIQVNAGVISISQSNITDLRLSEYCGITHGLIEQVDTTTLFSQYQSWYNQVTEEAETDIEAIKQQFQDNLTQFNQDWDEWFSQQQSGAFILNNEKGVPNGVATLDENGKVPDEQLPNIEIPVTSVNGKTGDVELDAADVGAETPEGSQAKANAALTAAKVYAEDVANTAEANAKNYAATVASAAEQNAKNYANGIRPTKLSQLQNDTGYITEQRAVSDSVNSTSSTTAASSKAVKTAYDKALEAFQSASDGKNAIASAITGMGQSASGSETFSSLAGKIKNISKDANADISHVLSGKTFYQGGLKRTGNMPNQGKKIITPSTTNITIPKGYHDGTGYVKGDSNLNASNIKKGVSIFGVAGNLNPQYYATGVRSFKFSAYQNKDTPANTISGISFTPNFVVLYLDGETTLDNYPLEVGFIVVITELYGGITYYIPSGGYVRTSEYGYGFLGGDSYNENDVGIKVTYLQWLTDGLTFSILPEYYHWYNETIGNVRWQAFKI